MIIGWTQAARLDIANLKNISLSSFFLKHPVYFLMELLVITGVCWCRCQCCCANDAEHTWKDDPVREGRICLIFTDKYTNTEWLSPCQHTWKHVNRHTDGEVSPLTILQMYSRGLCNNLAKPCHTFSSRSELPEDWLIDAYVNTMTPHSATSNSLVRQNGLQQSVFSCHLDVSFHIIIWGKKRSKLKVQKTEISNLKFLGMISIITYYSDINIML